MMVDMPDEMLVITRLSLHLLAEQVISPLRVQATGNEIALRPRPGGFGTPDLPGGGWAGVSGTDVVVVGADGDERRTAITSPRAAAAFVGLAGETLPDRALEVHAGAATVLADTFAIGEEALQALVAEAAPQDDASPIHLWPEHFDVAMELGRPGARATYGVSPGDEQHEAPYAYVAPWSAPPAGKFWNATAFTGAERPCQADDPGEIAAFFREAALLLRLPAGA
jgi:hypothetical protein